MLEHEQAHVSLLIKPSFYVSGHMAAMKNLGTQPKTFLCTYFFFQGRIGTLNIFLSTPGKYCCPKMVPIRKIPLIYA